MKNWAILFLALWLVPLVRAQQLTPHIAYVYPAGGRQGTTFQVTVGGQFLAAVSDAYVSDPGVETDVMEYNRPMAPKEFNELRDQLKKLHDEGPAAGAQSLEEIRDKILKNPPNRQANMSMVETITLKVSIAANAVPGPHEIRLKGPNGLSNPLVFCVGELPEFSKPISKSTSPELERFMARLAGKPATGIAAAPSTPKYEARVGLPIMVNGQILPGGVDRYLFSARKGQQLLVRAEARSLIPYLADAVPGWFEATLTVYDAKGNPLADAERYRFRPDPVIHFEVPADGDYAVEIHDSIFRGREDFVYRLTLGELPFVTNVFPLGGPAGAKTDVEPAGWNISTRATTLDNTGRAPGIGLVSVTKSGPCSNHIPFALDNLPECLDREPNNSPETAQPVALPVIINGRIEKPGDEDVFRFTGAAGEPIVAEVYARRLDSPLDSMLILTDATGRQLAFNDDHDDKEFGLETHQADSYLTATLPADGNYFLRIRDTQHHGGPDYAYRLRISRPRPDFALRVTPSSLNVRPGLCVPVTVYALRKDGFAGAIDLRVKGLPPGFLLSGARVPEGQDQVQFTLQAPPQADLEPFDLTVEGRTVIGGQEIIHDAVPAENMMQAFAYWQLVSVQELKVAMVGKPRPFAGRTIELVDPAPLRIPAGGSARVQISTPSEAFANRFDLELNGSPDGITLQSVSPDGSSVEIVVHCDAAKIKPGLQGNLIVNIVPKVSTGAQSAKKPVNQHPDPVGALPAIPFEVSVE